MAIREGIENQTNTEEQQPSTDTNPRLGVGTSQFVMMEQPNLTLEQTKDDLFGAVKSGNTVKVGELTGREPDVTRPDPSGTVRIEAEADHNRDHQDLEAQERKRLEELKSAGIGVNEPDGIATAENPLGLQIGPHHRRHHSGPVTDIVEAIEEGDYTAIAQIHMANALRELNEHIDVNGDGNIVGGERQPMSSMFTEDKFGMFHANDDEFVYDKFGGRYDAYGYRSGNGSYTNTSGEHYDSTSKTFTGKDGKPMEVNGAMKDMVKDDPEAGADYLQALDAQRHPEDTKTATPQAKVDGQKGSDTPGGGLHTTESPPPTEKQIQHATVDVHVKGMVAKAGIKTVPAYKYENLPAVQRMNWKLEQMPASERKHILASKANMEKFSAQYKQEILKEAKDANAANGKGQQPTEFANDEFKVVSADEVAKALHSQPIIHHHAETNTPASSSAGTAAPGTPTSSADKVETATSTTWIADKDGGFWDEYGGYYDKTGAYWDADGTYYSPDGKFSTDVNGATSWADGSYSDKQGHTIDKDGNYIDFDGTRIKPPEGVDFKKQMMEAVAKGERWTPPERTTPLEIATVPSTLLSEMPFSFNLKPLDLAPVTPTITNPASQTATVTTSATTTTATTKDASLPGSTIAATKTAPIATDTKADTSLKIDTSHFVQANVNPLPATSFASAFGDLHDWLMGIGTPSVTDTKSTSPSSLSSTLLSSTATVTPVATTTNKTAAPVPKPGM